jgi:hypothetical protein
MTFSFLLAAFRLDAIPKLDTTLACCGLVRVKNRGGANSSFEAVIQSRAGLPDLPSDLEVNKVRLSCSSLVQTLSETGSIEDKLAIASFFEEEALTILTPEVEANTLASVLSWCDDMDNNSVPVDDLMLRAICTLFGVRIEIESIELEEDTSFDSLHLLTPHSSSSAAPIVTLAFFTVTDQARLFET